ncbi:MFS transporter [Microbacterium sp. BG28]|uniref:MFS transporter n=1 Tax=Microbacterium sp. BG28 TaxID=3097356 RepID=UPI002A59E56A|nr:MFS transporter [Microbacterium sp. BG28]MDY0828270.1 MFS transporter [Microbacterium sp. BG28]
MAEAAVRPQELTETIGIFQSMNRARWIGFLVTIFATTYVLFSAMIVIPVIYNFYIVFADDLGVVNYIVSGGLLIAILANLVGARLMRRVRKRTLMLVGIAVFTLASTFQVAILDVTYVAIMATLAGVGCGLVVVAAPALLSEAYPDEKKRGTMLGWYNSLGSIVGALLSAVAGFVAANVSSWTSVYWLYAFSAVIFVLAFVFLPKTPTDTEKAQAAGTTTSADRIPLLPMASLSLAGFALSLVYMVPVYFISLMVLQNGLGDESASGLLSSATTIGSAVGCAVFGVLFRFVGRVTPAISFGLMTVSLLLLGTANVALVTAGCVMIGVSYGLGFVYCTVRATTIVAPSKVAVGLSISWAAINLGGFATTYLVSFLQGAFGLDPAGQIVEIFPVLLLITSMGTVLSLGSLLVAKLSKAGVSDAADPVS